MRAFRRLSAYAVAAGCLIIARTAAAGDPVPARPIVEVTNPWVAPGEALRVWVRCPPGAAAAGVHAHAFADTVLGRQGNGTWWFGAPVVSPQAESSAATLSAHCALSPRDATAAAAFRVTRAAQRWLADSTTAMAITGDVRARADSLVFIGGSRLPIVYLRDVPGTVSIVGAAANDAHASLYGIRSHIDPRLRAGNRLCGQIPTYLTVLRRAASGLIFLTVYASTTAPRGAATDGICASYTYSTNER